MSITFRVIPPAVEQLARALDARGLSVTVSLGDMEPGQFIIDLDAHPRVIVMADKSSALVCLHSGREAIEVIERVGRRFSLGEGERKGVLARLIEGGDLTRYGLHAAITRHSADDAIDYDRATELERIGGDVIDLTPADRKQLVPAK